MARKKTGYYTEADGRHVVKTMETYKDVTWVCKGTSYESYDMAHAAWQRNKEKRIKIINGDVDRKSGRIKLEVALTNWYDMYKRHEVVKGRPRSARTITTDVDTIKQICIVLGEKLVCDISSDVIQQYLLRLVRQGASDSTIRKRWNMLSMFFAHEYSDGGNPMARCTRPKSAKKVQAWTIDDDESTDKLAYTSVEMKQLATELSKPYNVHSKWHTTDRGYCVGEPLIVCMYEFLRVGEMVELRVKDILWEENMIYIRRQYDEQNKLVVPPKYGSKRKVPIMSECRTILQRACDGKQPDDLLFTAGIIYNPDKLTHGGHILRGRLRDALNTACERAGVERHTIHDLRHDGISRVVDVGAKPKSVQRWAGHKSLSITMDKYYRHNGSEDVEDMALVCGL